MTPLMVAANNGDAKSARLLVKHNADITPMGPMVTTLITMFVAHYACQVAPESVDVLCCACPA